MINNNTNIPYEIMTIDNIYTHDEIALYIKQIDNYSNKERLFSDNDFKNGKIYNIEHSDMIFNRIKPYLPSNYIDRNGKSWEFIGSCYYIFYAKLIENQHFGIHTDTGSFYDNKNNMYSKFTLLTYLNDDFIGGATQFYNSNLERTITIEPAINKTLIFDIDLFHKGDIILQGSKRWIGTEIVCRLKKV